MINTQVRVLCDSQIKLTSSELNLAGPWGKELEGYREKKMRRKF